jgi:hypothetical protein
MGNMTDAIFERELNGLMTILSDTALFNDEGRVPTSLRKTLFENIGRHVHRYSPAVHIRPVALTLKQRHRNPNYKRLIDEMMNAIR